MKKLSKDDFLKLHKSPGIIPGIHNYCDRWCEKCPKTQNCSVFATEHAFNEMNANESNRDENPFALMENMFEVTHSMLEEMAEKHGFDLEAIPEEASVDCQNEFERSQNHPLPKKGYDYFKMVDALLNDNDEYFSKTTDRKLLIFGESEACALLSLKESFEAIKWYSTLLPAKLHRAIGTYLEDDIDDDFMKGELYGTLKISLISTQRSMVAWAKVLEHFPEKEDDILPILVLLEQIYKKIATDFPQALLHKRPGLDD